MNENREYMTSEIEILWCPNGGRLVVTLPDRGILIRCRTAVDTFVEVIKRISIERVAELVEITIADNPLVSMTVYPGTPQKQVGEYYIITGLNPEAMQTKLRQIADRLDISLYTELFP